MTIPRRTPYRHARWSTPVALAVCIGLLGPGSPAIADEPASAQNRPLLIHELADTKVAGTLVFDSGNEPADEVLIFEDGTLTSQACAEWGYGPAPYWVRRGPAGLHFRASLESEEHGTIRFVGVFDGERVRATAVWHKERWYWTVEEKMRFTGRPLAEED